MVVTLDIDQTRPMLQGSSASDQGFREEPRTWKGVTAALAGDLAVFGLDVTCPMQLSW